MTLGNALVVVNAGSSSIKFTLYGEEGTDLSFFLKGQIEGLYTDGTHFTAREVGSGPVVDERWDGVAGTHDGAMRRLLDFVRTHLGGHRVEAVGHRIVHGGTDYGAPGRLDAEGLARLERLLPPAPLHQPPQPSLVRAVARLPPPLLHLR